MFVAFDIICPLCSVLALLSCSLTILLCPDSFAQNGLDWREGWEVVVGVVAGVVVRERFSKREAEWRGRVIKVALDVGGGGDFCE